MNEAGIHIIADLKKVPLSHFIKITDNIENFHDFMTKSSHANGMTLLKISDNIFNKEGAFTLLYLLGESHISLHSWPEHEYCAVDIFTCGTNGNPQQILQDIIDILGTSKNNSNILELHRKFN
jgi:S-adenosylmethionine decarboxylase